MWVAIRKERDTLKAERDALKKEIEQADEVMEKQSDENEELRAERDAAVRERDVSATAHKIVCGALAENAEQCEALRTRLAAVERDAKRLDALRDNSWMLEPFELSDEDIGWRVTERYIGKDEPSEVAIVYEDDPRKAIDAALTPTRHAAGGEG
jgi:hypothetical protein